MGAAFKYFCGTYVCMPLSIYACMRVSMYVCIYLYMDMCMYVCMYVCMHVYVCGCGFNKEHNPEKQHCKQLWLNVVLELRCFNFGFKKIQCQCSFNS